jgi:hypothetical protein
MAAIPDGAARHPPEPDRVLATILRTAIAAPMATAAKASDRRPSLLDACQAAGRRDVESFRGRLINNTSNGLLATFDGPGRAIRCAAAVRDTTAALGTTTTAGVHTGEVELRGDHVTGLSIQVAARSRPSRNLPRSWYHPPSRTSSPDPGSPSPIAVITS